MSFTSSALAFDAAFTSLIGVFLFFQPHIVADFLFVSHFPVCFPPKSPGFSRFLDRIIHVRAIDFLWPGSVIV